MYIYARDNEGIGDTGNNVKYLMAPSTTNRPTRINRNGLMNRYVNEALYTCSIR